MYEKYNLDFLEQKFGVFDKEFIYPSQRLVEGYLLYVEKMSKKQLDLELKKIKENPDLNPAYIWGYTTENNAVYVKRAFGENKLFTYNPKSIKMSEYVEGKKKLLSDLSEEMIDDLFDQKAVFNYFYRKLWDLRIKLAKEIIEKNNIPDNIALMEAQTIIDRIIFTYFICEKGLISEKESGPIKGNELFSNIISQFDNPLAWEYLKELFFERFAKKQVDHMDCDGVILDIPYLNGGLFREKILADKIVESDLEIDFEWKDLFKPLNKYIWLIEDEIPDFIDDYEGHLTPEIIGHIYEKFVISMDQLGEIKIQDLNFTDDTDEAALKKGNKIIGAYYTPENITKFISENTIYPYLLKKLEIPDQIPFFDLINQLNENELEKSLEFLNEVKICDPSCGSGAFLLKAGEILLEYKLKIERKLGKPTDSYTLKKEIIINNLHGVDIQEGAVEICKLRLWLWLISSSSKIDKKIPDTLPNIEYNFIIGNSLIGMGNEKFTQNILIKVDEKDIRPLIPLKSGYKDKQRMKIDEAIVLLNKTDIKYYARALSNLKSLYYYSERDNAEILKVTIEWIRDAIYSELNAIFYHLMESKNVKVPKEDYKKINPFHWRVDFYDIFEDGGFDIIIGNPPYGNILNKYEKKWINEIYNCKKAKNIAENFFERTLDVLLKKGEFMGYVIPKTIAFYGSWLEIRKKILSKNLKYTFDVGIGFVGVNYEEIVLIVQNQDYFMGDVEIFSSKNLKSPFKDKKAIHLGFTPQKSMKETNTIIFRPITPIEQKIIDLIDKNSIKFREFFDEKAFRGLYIPNKEKEMLSHGSYKWINKVPDVKRYYIDKYMEIDIEDKWRTKAEKILKPRLFFKVLRGKRLVCYADLNGEYLTTEKLVNVVIKPNEYKLETLMLIINSYIPSFYIQQMLFSETTETSRVMDDIYVGNLPIPKVPEDELIFEELYRFIIYLNSTEELRKSSIAKIDFIEQLIDCVVYELYLEEELGTGLNDLLYPLLTDNHFDSDYNIEIIEKFIEKIESNSVIKDEIKKIKDHEWIKVIENK